jgi:membrane-bound lytic murein transglycosylase D
MRKVRQRAARISLALVAMLLSSCAHFPRAGTPVASVPGVMGNDVGAASPARVDGTTIAAIAPDAPPTVADLNDTGADLKAVPLAVNRQVLQWIDYFQGQGRPHMERYLSRSTRYMPVMKKILKENGLPEDLIYIALIESGFNGTAKSHASAVGYWQFIRATGKRYGMRIDTYVDDRRDFVRSTQAAADYFKGLYEIFHSWYLAIASYNVGEGRVKNLVVKYRTRDFWQLARENKLPDETSNYVPKFIAARLIAKEPEKYGFTEIDYQAALEYSEVEFTTSIDLRKLATAMGLEYDDLRDLNPAYKRGVAFEKNGKLMLRVPKGTDEKALASATEAVALSRQSYVADEDYGYYRIRRGDTISVIARKFGTSQSVIRKLNKMGSRSNLVAGRRIRVPADDIPEASKPTKRDISGSTSAPKIGVGAVEKYMGKFQTTLPAKRSVANGLESSDQAEDRSIHIVRRGDTLVKIARKYRVSIRELARHNRIQRRSKVTVGTHLEIP